MSALPPIHWPRIAEIQTAACTYFGVALDEMGSDRRGRAVVRPRQVAMFLARELTSQSLPAIGRSFGGRDHSTVIHAIRSVERQLAIDPELSVAVHEICRASAHLAADRVFGLAQCPAEAPSGWV